MTKIQTHFHHLLLIVLVFSQIQANEAHKCQPEGDKLEDAKLWWKKQLVVEMRWLSFEPLQSGESELLSVIESKLNQTLIREEDVEMKVNLFSNSSSINGNLLVANVAFKTDEAPSSSKPLSDKLLKVLDNIVNCARPCKVSSVIKPNSSNSDPLIEKLFTVTILEKFSLDNHDISLVQSRTALVILELPDVVGKKNETQEGQCDLCQHVISSRISRMNLKRQEEDRFLLSDMIETFVKCVKTFINLLEPNQWLILVVATWLITCLVIATLIQRRDKRRLRLYLEERAEDYSFSTKR